MARSHRRQVLNGAAALAVAAACVLTVAAGPSTAAPRPAGSPSSSTAILNGGAPDAVPGEYIVVLEDQTLGVAGASRATTALAKRHGGHVLHRYGRVLDGYAAKMSQAQARRVAADPSVAYVQQSNLNVTNDVQSNPPNWGDDRIDQSDLPLDRSYQYPASAGQGVHVYVLDSGVNLAHVEFGGRTGAGTDIVDGDDNPADCTGHGTHVAGTVLGTKYGVAKLATLHAVRINNCSGSATDAQVLAGMEWVKANAIRPAVVNYSTSCSSRCSKPALDTGVKELVASGITWVQSAGNSNDDACHYSPQRLPEGITVGNVTASDAKASTSGWGSCTDLWAPGTNIVSASRTSTTGTATLSGTSMAAPHVAGAAALYLGEHPSASPAQVQGALVNNAVPNTLTGIGASTPNRLLNVDFLSAGTPGTVSVADPGNQTSTVGGDVSLASTVSGGTAPYVWTATGLPAGLAIDSATGAISGTVTQSGSSTVTVTATDSSSPALSGSRTFTWAVNPVDACPAQTNGTDMAIPDLGTAESSITMSGCSGNASATSRVEVHIRHTYVGDLVVSLVAPDGSSYVLRNRTGGRADNIDETFTVNLSGEARSGTWRLRVRDAESADVGSIDSWTLTV